MCCCFLRHYWNCFIIDSYCTFEIFSGSLKNGIQHTKNDNVVLCMTVFLVNFFTASSLKIAKLATLCMDLKRWRILESKQQSANSNFPPFAEFSAIPKNRLRLGSYIINHAFSFTFGPPTKLYKNLLTCCRRLRNSMKTSIRQHSVFPAVTILRSSHF